MKGFRFLLRWVPATLTMFFAAIGSLLVVVFVGIPVLAILAAAGFGGAAAFFWMLWALLGAIGGEAGAWRDFVTALLLCAGAITVSATVFHYGIELLRKVASSKPRPALSLALRDAPFNT